MPLNTEEIAPDFTLPSTSGRDFTLSRDARDKSCILYFYPKDFTRGCTKEACEFRDTFAFFKKWDIPIYGISRDAVDTHLEFKAAHHLPFDLLSDEKGTVTALYKAAIPLLGISRRITYLLDEKHKVAAVYENLFAAGSHIKKMMEALEARAGNLN